MKKQNVVLKYIALAAVSFGLSSELLAAVGYEVAQQATAVTANGTFLNTTYQQTIGFNGYSGRTENLIFSFYLPTLNLGESFSTFTFSANSNWTSTTQKTDIYGLGTSSSYTPTGTPYYSGANDTTLGVTKLQSGYLNPSTVNSTSPRPSGLTTSNNFASYINSLYIAGNPTNTYVLLRFNQQALGQNGVDFNSMGSESIHGYPNDLPAGYNTTTGFTATVPVNWAVPFISYTVVPEPSTWAMGAMVSCMVILEFYRRRRSFGKCG